MILIQAEQLSKTYRTGEVQSTALERVSFSIQAGAFPAIDGPSCRG